MHMELANCTWTLLNEIENRTSRDNVAITYALAIMSSEPTDWKQVNEAILAKWSVSGLNRIKNKAWKLVKEKRPQPKGESKC